MRSKGTHLITTCFNLYFIWIIKTSFGKFMSGTFSVVCWYQLALLENVDMLLQYIKILYLKLQFKVFYGNQIFKCGYDTHTRHIQKIIFGYYKIIVLRNKFYYYSSFTFPQNRCLLLSIFRSATPASLIPSA